MRTMSAIQSEILTLIAIHYQEDSSLNNRRLYVLIEVHRTGGVAAAGSQWLSKDGAATLGFRFALARQIGPTRRLAF